jgi:hypothetical protein
MPKLCLASVDGASADSSYRILISIETNIILAPLLSSHRLSAIAVISASPAAIMELPSSLSKDISSVSPHSQYGRKHQPQFGQLQKPLVGTKKRVVSDETQAKEAEMSGKKPKTTIAVSVAVDALDASWLAAQTASWRRPVRVSISLIPWVYLLIQLFFSSRQPY